MKTAKKSQNTDRWLTLLQVVVGLAVLAGLLWIAARLLGYARARAGYRQIATAYTAAAPQPEQEGQGAPAAAGSLTVDFAALQAQYPDAAAWLQMDDLPRISYPVMHAADNSYYLRRAPDGSHSESGSLFADAFNTAVTDPYVLVYGHHMQDGSMFAGLLAYQDEDFYRSGSGCFTLYSRTACGVTRSLPCSLRTTPARSTRSALSTTKPSAHFLQQVKAGSLYDNRRRCQPGGSGAEPEHLRHRQRRRKTACQCQIYRRRMTATSGGGAAPKPYRKVSPT